MIILDEGGLQALADFRLPLLTWKESQELKVRHALITDSGNLIEYLYYWIEYSAYWQTHDESALLTSMYWIGV